MNFEVGGTCFALRFFSWLSFTSSYVASTLACGRQNRFSFLRYRWRHHLKRRPYLLRNLLFEFSNRNSVAGQMGTDNVNSISNKDFRPKPLKAKNIRPRFLWIN